MASLLAVAREHHIEAASFQGIGAVSQVEIGSYDLEAREYRRQMLPDIYELLTISGNVTLKDGELFAHAHVTLGDHDLRVIGGHLFECTTAVTVELFLRPSDAKLGRELDDRVGLATICPL